MPGNPGVRARARDVAADRRIVACIALAAFIFQFDAFQLTICLPAIVEELRISSTLAACVVTGYLFTAVALFLPAAGLGERLGFKRVLFASVLILALGTLCCGSATRIQELIVGRVIQGAGASGMAALGYVAISTLISQERRGWGFGWLNLGAGLGMLTGVVLGGLLTQFVAWRAVFFATLLPLSALLLGIVRWLPGDALSDRTTGGKFPLVNALLLAVALGAVVVALSLQMECGWGSPFIVGTLMVALAAGGALVVRSRHEERETGTPGLFRNRRLLAALGVLFLARLAFGGDSFLMPFFLQRGCGFSPGLTGLTQLCGVLALVLVSLLAGKMSDRAGARPVIICALLLATVAFFLFGEMAPSFDWRTVLLYLPIVGSAMAMFSAPNNKQIVELAAEDRKEGKVAALIPVVLNMGTLMGVCIMETLLEGFSSYGPSPHPSAVGGPVFPQGAALGRGLSVAYSFGAVALAVAAILVVRLYPTPGRRSP